MATGFEGVGEAVTGGMIARAVEPEPGETVDVRRGQLPQLRRRARRAPIASRCGQPGHVHRTLCAPSGTTSLHSVLHFDGKIWRTLPLLAWRPGRADPALCRRRAGQFRLADRPVPVLGLPDVRGLLTGRRAVRARIDAGPDAARLSEAQGDFARNRRSRGETERSCAASGRSSSRRASRPPRSMTTSAKPNARSPQERLSSRIAGSAATAAPAAAGARGPANAGSRRPPSTSVATGHRAGSTDRIRKAKENPALLAYKLQTNAYKFSWALIPISVPFVWLLFLHRRRYRRYKAYDHIVFVTYSIAFMSLG